MESKSPPSSYFYALKSACPTAFHNSLGHCRGGKQFQRCGTSWWAGHAYWRLWSTVYGLFNYYDFSSKTGSKDVRCVHTQKNLCFSV